MSQTIKRSGVNARLKRASRPAQFFEPGIANAEVVRDFVDDCLSNLGLHLILVAAMTTDSPLVQRDPVRHDTAVTDRTSLGERDPLVESEEVPTWRGIINDDRKILYLGREFVGQRLERLFGQLFEAFIGYLEHQRSVSVSQPRSGLTNRGIGASRTHYPDDTDTQGDPVIIPLSILDLAAVMSVGSTAQALRETTTMAVDAQRPGFQRLWSSEHHAVPAVASSAPSGPDRPSHPSHRLAVYP